MIIEVSFSRDVATAYQCPRCDGRGETPECFGSDRIVSCPYCSGSGRSPHPRVFAYVVDGDPQIGDAVSVPPSEFRPGGIGWVASVGSTTYDGPLRRALLVA